MSKSYPILSQFHKTNRRKLGKVAIKSLPMQWIRKSKSMRLISKMDERRVLRDEVEVVRDEWTEREEIAESIEYQEEVVDCLLSRGGKLSLIVSDSSVG